MGRKICIYTFLWTSYGAALQAYSLQRVIKEICPDDDVRNVRFQTADVESKMRIFRSRSSNRLLNVVRNAQALLYYRQLKHKRDSFNRFHKNFFSFTPRYSTVADLLANPPQADIHLSGSDQVFLPTRKERDVHYLNFPKGNARKVAYAPSFGRTEFTEEERQYILNCLGDFDTLSCREQQGAAFMSQLLQRDVPTVIDPVFLTPRQHWHDLAVPPKTGKPYVLVFSLKKSKRMISDARRMAKHYANCQVVVLSPTDFNLIKGCRCVFSAGPQEFLGWIEHAQYIITDSFHCTAFSLIFHRPFSVYITRPKVSSRIESLLSQLSMTHHIIRDSYPAQVLSGEEDYQDKLDGMVSDSRVFLENMIHKTRI